MAAFDFEGAVGGAAGGASFGGPIGAAIGFVLGGFIGGKDKDAAKKAAARRERQLQFLASAENFNRIARQLTPGFVALANQSVGPAAASAAATQSARRGLTGTGLGSALATNAAAAPGIAASKAAFQQAGQIQANQIAALGGTVIPGLAGLAQPGGLPGDTLGQLGALGKGLGLQGNRGGDDLLVPRLQPFTPPTSPLSPLPRIPTPGEGELIDPQIGPLNRRRQSSSASPFRRGV